MLDINLIRSKPEEVKRKIASKGADPGLVDDFLGWDEKWRQASAQIDNLKAERNRLSKTIAQNSDSALLDSAKKIKADLEGLIEDQRKFDQKRQEILALIPNLPFDDVPLGKDENDNKVIKEAGEKKEFDFPPKSYLDIAEKLGVINTAKAALVAGSRFGYLLGDAAMLEFALIQLAVKTLTKEGFIPIIPPVMARPEIMEKMGKGQFLREKDAFYLEEDKLFLVGSSEHTIGPFHLDDVFKESDLPRRYLGFSTCFRREAGSYGKDTKGILRVHQFDKLEMFSFAHPDSSEAEHKFLLSLQEKLVSALELPYRVVEISTGDMGWADARQYDLEVWLPGTGRYREITSASNTTDYQARGINARFKDGQNRLRFVHTLNATAFAIGRMIIAIIENYQTKSGSVAIPAALKEFMGKDEISAI